MIYPYLDSQQTPSVYPHYAQVVQQKTNILYEQCRQSCEKNSTYLRGEAREQMFYPA